MGNKALITIRASLLISLTVSLTLLSTRLQADTGTCGGASITLPFTDVSSSNVFFCSIAEAFFSGLSNGTSPSTYNPSDNVSREQMAAFVTRTMDQSLKRGSRRAALSQYWTPTSANDFGYTALGLGKNPALIQSDGADIWTANSGAGTVSRIRASDGKRIEEWTGAAGATGVLAAKGLIFVTGPSSPGKLYQIDPTQSAGAVTTLSSALGNGPQAIAFDGARIWTANTFNVSIVSLNPVSITTVTSGLVFPKGILFDGTNIWVTDQSGLPGNIFKLDSNGAIIQTMSVGDNPRYPVFDGTNIWVPNNSSNSVTVVRASTGAVVATLIGNGLSGPTAAAFDGERILITNQNGDSVSLWKAADLSPLGFVSTGPGTGLFGACSDGLNFWVAMQFTNQIGRF
jgi:hypothetical protein